MASESPSPEGEAAAAQPLREAKAAKPRFPRDRRLHFKVHACIFLVWLLVLIVKRTGEAWPESLQALYPEHVAFLARLAVEKTTNWFPFSVFESAAVVIVLAVAVRALIAIVHLVARTRRLRNAIAGGFLLVVSLCCVIDIWGGSITPLTYNHLAQYWDWLNVPNKPAAPEETVAVMKEIVAGINADYEKTSGNVFVGPDAAFIREINAAIESGFLKVAPSVDLPASYAVQRGRAKPLLFSEPWAYAGLLGYYAPWTQEALYNRNMPKVEIPSVIAHEKAHMRGIDHEDEASLLGCLACINSGNVAARVSAYAELYILLARALQTQAEYDAIVNLLRPDARRDFREMIKFAKRYGGAVSDFAGKLQDLTLKTEGEERGIKAYDDTRIFWAVVRSKKQLLFPDLAKGQASTDPGS